MIFGDYKHIVIVAGMNIVSCSKCIFFKTRICLLLISLFRVNKRRDLLLCYLVHPPQHSVLSEYFSVLRAYL